MGAMSAGGVISISSVDTVNPQLNALDSNVANATLHMRPEPFKPNEFQKFVCKTADYKLPLYGHQFFGNM